MAVNATFIQIVKPYSLADSYQRFGEKYCVILQGRCVRRIEKQGSDKGRGEIGELREITYGRYSYVEKAVEKAVRECLKLKEVRAGETVQELTETRKHNTLS